MALSPKGSDFLSRYLMAQVALLGGAILIGIPLSVLKESNWWFLYLALATIPLSLIAPIFVGVTGEKAVDALYGLKQPPNPYPKSGLFEADMQKANALRREKRYPETLELYGKICQLAPERIEPFFELADTYRLSGDAERAISAYIRVVMLFEKKLGPDYFLISESHLRCRQLITKAKDQKKQEPSENDKENL